MTNVPELPEEQAQIEAGSIVVDVRNEELVFLDGGVCGGPWSLPLLPRLLRRDLHEHLHSHYYPSKGRPLATSPLDSKDSLEPPSDPSHKMPPQPIALDYWLTPTPDTLLQQIFSLC